MIITSFHTRLIGSVFAVCILAVCAWTHESAAQESIPHRFFSERTADLTADVFTIENNTTTLQVCGGTAYEFGIFKRKD